VPATHDRYIATFVARLAASGVRHAVIAPGSRSTPLTLALTAPGLSIRPWLQLDERSAGYFALGIARQLGEPVALVCTSGTAAANFLPAVVEASLSRVPLVVLTADRPPELRDRGASQTIDQVNLFGRHAKWFADMPVGTDDPLLERYARSTASRAAALAVESPAGAVHLNFPFREPLLDADMAGAPAETVADIGSFGAARLTPDADDVRRLAGELRGRRGLIVAGPESGGLPVDAIVALGAALGWPVVADPLSGLRTGAHDQSLVIEGVDTLAREPEFTSRATPEVVLRFGAPLTSKPLNVWLAGVEGLRQFVVDDAATGTGGLRGPNALEGATVRADSGLLCEVLVGELGGDGAVDGSWRALWCDANVVVSSALGEAIGLLEVPFEGRGALDLAATLPDGATLVVGNSMPVRDIDSFFPRVERGVRIVGTRGAAGIDGVVSTAAGAAAVAEGPVVLVIGDLSFFHDQNGLWAVKRHGLDLTVLLVNNDGGGIFEFLPQRELASERFEEWFGTAHGLDLSQIVTMYGGRHSVVERDAREALRAAIGSPGLDVVELRTDRSTNVGLHRAVFDEARAALRAQLESTAGGA
jgi:2-succinyl-5-enolpyruvyl-6-hydroxy-3-cyclohexene-1-carboxylate synthase